MSEFIERLWYMCDNDNGIGGREDIMVLHEDVRTAEGKLRESLSAEQCALFDKYIDEVYALMESGNKAAFEMGLKFAMGFVFNTMDEDASGKFGEGGLTRDLMYLTNSYKVVKTDEVPVH